MRVCYQPSVAAPGDWLEVDSAGWSATPKRPVPVGGEIIDDQPGWVHGLCVQGLSLAGDHYAVIDRPGDITEAVSWVDDPQDGATNPRLADGEEQRLWYCAHRVRFEPLQADPALGGAINTRIVRTVYAAPRAMEGWLAMGPLAGVTVLPWSDFVPPEPGLVRHGIWVPDDLHLLHESRRSLAGWRSWTEGLDPADLDQDGLVRPQYALGRMSPPRGTITYFLRDTDQASGVHVVTHENQLSDTAGAGETEGSSNLADGEDNLEFLYATLASNPNSADWPSGAYECQTDCSAIGGDVSYGLLTLGASPGHFANVDSGLTTDNETWTQTQAAFASPGLNLASRTLDPAAGNATDRYENLIAGQRATTGGHGNQTFTMRYNSDAFARGPWAAGTTVNADAEMAVAWSSIVDRPALVQVSWPAMIDVPREVPVSWQGALVVDAAREVEVSWLAGVDAPAEVPAEWSALVDAPRELGADWSRLVAPEARFPVSWMTLVQPDSEIPVEWSGAVLVDAPAVFPVEWSGTVLADRIMVADWTAAVVTKHDLPAEFRSGVVADARVLVDWLAGVAPEHRMPVDWSTPLVVIHSAKFPVEWTGSGFVAGQVTVFRVDERGAVFGVPARPATFRAGKRAATF